MFNKFKKGSKVIVNGIGLKSNKFYKNKPGWIVERDPYYLDYLVHLKNGTEDWFSSKYLRKPYSIRKKQKRRNKDEN